MILLIIMFCYTLGAYPLDWSLLVLKVKLFLWTYLRFFLQSFAGLETPNISRSLDIIKSCNIL